MIINHVHIGPGKLGLGLIAPVIYLLGHKSTLLARHNDKKQAIYNILINQREYQVNEMDTGKKQSVKGINLIIFDKDWENSIKSIANENTVLLTTAVNSNNLVSIAPLIAKGIERRIKLGINSHLYVIACENLEQNSQTLKKEVIKLLSLDILKEYPKNVSFLNTVVDRICKDPKKIEKEVIVPTESWIEWIVDSSNAIKKPSFLKAPIKVISNKSKFKFYEKRKAWIINGTHFAISIYGYKANIMDLKAIIKDPNILERIRNIQKGFALALNYYAQQELKLSESKFEDIRIQNIENYGVEMIERIKAGPDDTADRILFNLLRIHLDKEGTKKDLKISLGKINKIIQDDVKSITQFIVKSYNKICDPVGFLLELENKSEGAIFREKPEIAREIINYFISTQYIMKKELESYSGKIS